MAVNLDLATINIKGTRIFDSTNNLNIGTNCNYYQGTQNVSLNTSTFFTIPTINNTTYYIECTCSASQITGFGIGGGLGQRYTTVFQNSSGTLTILGVLETVSIGNIGTIIMTTDGGTNILVKFQAVGLGTINANLICKVSFA